MVEKHLPWKFLYQAIGSNLDLNNMWQLNKLFHIVSFLFFLFFIRPCCFNFSFSFGMLLENLLLLYVISFFFYNLKSSGKKVKKESNQVNDNLRPIDNYFKNAGPKKPWNSYHLSIIFLRPVDNFTCLFQIFHSIGSNILALASNEKRWVTFSLSIYYLYFHRMCLNILALASTLSPSDKIVRYKWRPLFFTVAVQSLTAWPPRLKDLLISILQFLVHTRSW